MAAGAIKQNEVFRANQLFLAGQYEAAASEFIHSARRMEKAGRPRQAANLHARAAIAWAKGGMEEKANNQANIAFSQFTLLGMQQRISEFKMELEQALHPAGTAALVTGGTKPLTTPPLPASQVRSAPAAAIKRGKLPPACSECGAPVRADQVQWIDASSAECDFCGAILAAE